MSLHTNVKRGLKIAVALVLSLVGLVLLPVVALPYGALDWLHYDPAYQGGYAYLPTPVLPPVPVAPVPIVLEIPCAELLLPGELWAASVNGQGIGLRAFERETARFLDSLVSLGADLESAERRAEMPTLKRQVLNLLVDDVLVQQAGVDLGIAVPDEAIQARVGEQIASGGGLETFQFWLEETGQTWEEFRQQVCQDLLRQTVFEEVTTEITGTVDMVWARTITVATSEDAVAVLSRLASGEDFSQVAREVSLDSLTRGRGGDLGWVPEVADWLPPEVVAAALAGSPGQVQKPIRVGDEYVIVQTIERQSDRPLDPEMRESLRAGAFERWLAGRRRQANIEILVDLGG